MIEKKNSRQTAFDLVERKIKRECPLTRTRNSNWTSNRYCRCFSSVLSLRTCCICFWILCLLLILVSASLAVFFFPFVARNSPATVCFESFRNRLLRKQVSTTFLSGPSLKKRYISHPYIRLSVCFDLSFGTQCWRISVCHFSVTRNRWVKHLPTAVINLWKYITASWQTSHDAKCD